jgi:hypothetical protein
MQTLGTGYQRSGRNSRIAIGSNSAGTSLALAKWEVTWDTGDQDTTNFTSQQANNHMATEGIYDVDEFPWSMDGDWDANNIFCNNITSPASFPGIFPRDDLANLYFIINTNDSPTPYWLYPYARVRSAKNGTAVKEKVSFSASGKNQGLVTVP